MATDEDGRPVPGRMRSEQARRDERRGGPGGARPLSVPLTVALEPSAGVPVLPALGGVR